MSRSASVLGNTKAPPVHSVQKMPATELSNANDDNSRNRRADDHSIVSGQASSESDSGARSSHLWVCQSNRTYKSGRPDDRSRSRTQAERARAGHPVKLLKKNELALIAWRQESCLRFAGQHDPNLRIVHHVLKMILGINHIQRHVTTSRL